MPLDFETASRRCEPSERRLVEQQESAKQPYGQLANARVNSIAISNLVLVYGMFSCVFAADISVHRTNEGKAAQEARDATTIR
jgi:hypothetical protein